MATAAASGQGSSDPHASARCTKPGLEPPCSSVEYTQAGVGCDKGAGVARTSMPGRHMPSMRANVLDAELGDIIRQAAEAPGTMSMGRMWVHMGVCTGRGLLKACQCHRFGMWDRGVAA